MRLPSTTSALVPIFYKRKTEVDQDEQEFKKNKTGSRKYDEAWIMKIQMHGYVSRGGGRERERERERGHGAGEGKATHSGARSVTGAAFYNRWDMITTVGANQRSCILQPQRG